MTRKTVAKPAPKSPSPQPLAPPTAAQRRANEVAVKRLEQRAPRLEVVLESSKDGIGNIGPDHADREGWLARMEDLFGSNGRNFPIAQINHLLRVVRLKDGSYDPVRANALLAVIEAARPENEVQALLAVQLAVTHELALQALQRAMLVDQIPQYDSAGNMAVKLLRTFTMQVEALAKLQRGGEQVVKVVHVHSGGRALVGHITTSANGSPSPGGASGATGGGGAYEIEHQPHAKGELPAPSTSPMPEMRREDAQRASVPVASGRRKASL